MLLAAPEHIHENEMKNYEECLNYIFDLNDKRIKKIINLEDDDNHVPLHYSTDYWPQYITQNLLENGAMASIGKLRHGQPIIKKIKQEVGRFELLNRWNLHFFSIISRLLKHSLLKNA